MRLALFSAILCILIIAVFTGLTAKRTPVYGWKLFAQQDFSLNPVGPNSAARWNLTSIPAGENVRVEVSSEGDVMLNAGNCTIRGFKLDTECRLAISPAVLTIEDVRLNDPVSASAMLFSRQQRDRMLTSNRVHFALYRMACITNCPQ